MMIEKRRKECKQYDERERSIIHLENKYSPITMYQTKLYALRSTAVAKQTKPLPSWNLN